MAGTNGSTKAKLKAVTSPIKASRQLSPVNHNTSDGQESVTSVSAELVADALAKVLDLMDTWPCKIDGKTMPKPFIAAGHVFIALPSGGHVIENTVTSNGKHMFSVNGTPVIPVTSESEN